MSFFDLNPSCNKQNKILIDKISQPFNFFLFDIYNLPIYCSLTSTAKHPKFPKNVCANTFLEDFLIGIFWKLLLEFYCLCYFKILKLWSDSSSSSNLNSDDEINTKKQVKNKDYIKNKKVLDNENIWKENKKTRKDYFCRQVLLKMNELKLIEDQQILNSNEKQSKDTLLTRLCL
ncbi:hypothetical protein RFI_21847 [Reticulomyxa filosa]|uniref:Uncharacterized protein n=1 Tax=Reticulomyxa filosa TaxID=46433 RepID=X6MPC4_RETFI|nr:hypothetical protein RFI_21847 [Reticulomyxa filosa]|eukprot:ETO15516.1 hypothetical protein RFI_21847 [Reticulomyxa filosa]